MKTGYSAAPPASIIDLSGVRIALITTRWNPEIIDALRAGARRFLLTAGIAERHIGEWLVPGAYELPLAADRALAHHDGVIALGAVIRGETPHFEYVAGECARGLMDVQLRRGRPIGFGVLTVNTEAQALARCGSGDDNKGFEAAAAVLDMIVTLRSLP